MRQEFNITDISGSFTLHNGVKMPYLGLGVYQSRDGEQVIDAINWSLEAGYRHIDTAAIYGNERGVGSAVRNSGIDRRELFVVSKVWNSDHGYKNTINAFNQSMEKLQLEYLDLYLIHWPKQGRIKETWKALEELYESGRVKAIGVSNFLKHHLTDLLEDVRIVPMVNQMEFHPRLVQQDLLDFCKSKNIQYEAWSPIMKGRVMEIPLLQELSEKYGKTEVQVVLRWDLQKGVITIPKSSRKDRIISNADIFDFELSAEDIGRIDQLHQGQRTGPDPDNFNF